MQDIEILKSLASLWEEWPEISSTLEDLQKPKTFDQWMTLVVSEIESDEVKEILAKVGLEHVQQNLAGWLDKVPENTRDKLKMLVSTLADFDDVADDKIAFPLVNLDTAASGSAKASWSFAIKGAASLELEADASWPYANDEVTDRLLAMRTACKADAAASAKLPLQFGSIAAEAGTEQSIMLAQYFAIKDRSVSLARSGANSLAFLANPLSFDSMWRRLSSPESDLAGITVDYDGSIHANVAVGLSKAIGTDDFDLSAGATIDVGFKRPAAMSLSLRRGESLGLGNAVVFTLSRNTSIVRNAGATAELKVDLSKSASKLHDLLQKGLGHWENGLEVVQPYLKPGTLIRTKLLSELQGAAAKLVNDPALRTALQDDARMALGLDADNQSELSEWLMKLVTDKVDTYAGKYTSKTKNAVDAATQEILGELPAVMVLGNDATGKVQTEVKKLIEKAEKKFVSKVKEVYEGAKNSTSKKAELGKELGRIGEVSSSAVTKLDGLLKPLRKIIDDYDTLFRKFVKLTEDEARREIAASLSVEDVSSEGKNFEFSGTFHAPTAEAASLYRSLMVGGYQTVEKQLHGPGGCPGFTLDRSKSMISRYSEHIFSWGFKLQMFGLGLSGRTQLSSKAQITTNGDGTITLDLRGAAERKLAKGGDSRSFEFVNSARIQLLRKAAETAPSRLSEESITFRMLYQEKKLERREIVVFLEDLATTAYRPPAEPGSPDFPAFLNQASQNAALAKFNEWVSNPGDVASIAAALEIRLSLAADKIVARLSQPPADPAVPADPAHPVEIFNTAMVQFAKNGAFDENDWAEFMRSVSSSNKKHKNTLPKGSDRDTRDYRSMSGIKYKTLDKRRKLGPRGGKNKAGAIKPGHERVRQTVERANSFVKFMQTMTDIYALPIKSDDSRTQKEGRRLEEILAACVANIVSTGAGTADFAYQALRLFRFDTGVSARTLTFLQLLHSQFAIDKPLVTLTIKMLDGDTIKDQIAVP